MRRKLKVMSENARATEKRAEIAAQLANWDEAQELFHQASQEYVEVSRGYTRRAMCLGLVNVALLLVMAAYALRLLS